MSLASSYATLGFPHPEPVEGRTIPHAVLINRVSAYLYILRCADGWYYVGTTQASLEQRIAQHDAGTFDGYTGRRRPVVPVFHEHFERITDAIAAERQVKGWRRDK